MQLSADRLQCQSRCVSRDSNNTAPFGATSSSPDKALKVPVGHNVHAPADAPPQPLRYSPAVQDEAEQVEQKETPGQL